MLLPLSSAAAPAPPRSGPLVAPAVLEVSPAVASAARALGDDVRFYTSAARPLSRLDELAAPEMQVATASIGLARGLTGLLRAGGLNLPRDAYSLAGLTG